MNMPISASITNVSAIEEVLPLSVALNRFEPPGTLFEATEAKEWTRYGYQIGTINLLIGLSTGSEIIPMEVLTPIPNTPTYLRGILNLRSNLVPVFDLKLLLGLDNQDTDNQEQLSEQKNKPMVLILDKGDKAVGIIVDGFPQALLGLQRLQRLPQLPNKLEGCVSTGYMKEESLWLEFDHEVFFSTLVAANTE